AQNQLIEISNKHAVALQIDDLLGLGDDEGHRVFLALVRVRADETVLLEPLGSVLLDGAGGLIVAVRPERRGLDAVAFVFDRRHVRSSVRLAGSAAGETRPCRLELRQHRLLCSPTVGADPPGARRSSNATLSRARGCLSTGAAGARGRHQYPNCSRRMRSSRLWPGSNSICMAMA